MSTTPGATAFTRIPSFAYSHRQAAGQPRLSRPWVGIMGTESRPPAIGLSASETVTVTIRAPRLLGQHPLDRELGDVEEALQVRRDERPEIIRRVVGKRFCKEDARVVDQRNRSDPNRFTEVSAILMAEIARSAGRYPRRPEASLSDGVKAPALVIWPWRTATTL